MLKQFNSASANAVTECCEHIELTLHSSFVCDVRYFILIIYASSHLVKETFYFSDAVIPTFAFLSACCPSVPRVLLPADPRRHSNWVALTLLLVCKVALRFPATSEMACACAPGRHLPTPARRNSGKWPLQRTVAAWNLLTSPFTRSICLLQVPRLGDASSLSSIVAAKRLPLLRSTSATNCFDKLRSPRWCQMYGAGKSELGVAAVTRASEYDVKALLLKEFAAYGTTPVEDYLKATTVYVNLLYVRYLAEQAPSPSQFAGAMLWQELSESEYRSRRRLCAKWPSATRKRASRRSDIPGCSFSGMR